MLIRGIGLIQLRIGIMENSCECGIEPLGPYTMELINRPNELQQGATKEDFPDNDVIIMTKNLEGNQF